MDIEYERHSNKSGIISFKKFTLEELSSQLNMLFLYFSFALLSSLSINILSVPPTCVSPAVACPELPWYFGETTFFFAGGIPDSSHIITKSSVFRL